MSGIRIPYSTWTWFTIGVLLGLLAFQSIWLIGTTTLRDHERFQRESIQVREEIARIRAAADMSTNATAATSLLEPLNKRIDNLDPQIGSAAQGICVWNKLWRWLIVFGESKPCDSLGSREQLAELRSANSATQVLGLYILPLFYGWLGALLSVMQRLREDDSPESIRRLKPGSRVTIGMVAGPMIGLFLSPEFLNSLAFQATPFVVAFLGGYSTEVFFAAVDRVLAAFRSALAGEQKPRAQAQSGGANKKE